MLCAALKTSLLHNSEVMFSHSGSLGTEKENKSRHRPRYEEHELIFYG